MTMFTKLTSIVAILAFLTLGVRAQKAADIEAGAKGVTASLASVDVLRGELEALNRQTQQTLRVLLSSKAAIEKAGMKQAATDIGALAQAIQQLEAQTNDNIRIIARIRTEGAGDEGDPLGELEKRITTASKSRNLKQQESALIELCEEVKESKRLRPFIGVLHYRTGEALRKRANLLLVKQTSTDTRNAEILLKRACKSYEAAATAKIDDVADTSIGSSSKASSLYQLVRVYGSLYLGYSRLSSSSAKRKANAYGWKANQTFLKLQTDHPDAMLDRQRRAVETASRDIERMKGR